ncbi:MAG: ABC transporter permease [Acidiferrobacterales bacterium]|nr:ABC transporter permease [Acidiferrobacterales bacterium]
MNRSFKYSSVALQTLTRKEVARFMRIWTQTLIPPVITTCLYFLIFGNLIGPRIGPMQGHSYIDFIVPGLVLMSVITGAYTNVASSFFSAKFQRYIEEIMVSPVPNYVILIGYLVGGMVRGILVGMIVLAVSALFATVDIVSPVIAIVIFVLTALVFSLGGMINGMFARKFDDISIIPNFVLTPLIYLGGVFYSVQMLPEFWQIVSLANPILYVINVARFAFLGSSDVGLLASFSVIGTCIVTLFTLCMILLRRGYGIRE